MSNRKRYKEIKREKKKEKTEEMADKTKSMEAAPAGKPETVDAGPQGPEANVPAGNALPASHKYILVVSSWLPVGDSQKVKNITNVTCGIMPNRASVVEAVADCMLSDFQNDINIFREGVPFDYFKTPEWDVELGSIFTDSEAAAAAKKESMERKAASAAAVEEARPVIRRVLEACGVSEVLRLISEEAAGTRK